MNIYGEAKQLLKEVFPIWRDYGYKYGRGIPSSLLKRKLDTYWDAYYYIHNNYQTEEDLNKLAFQQIMLKDFVEPRGKLQS
ncbi:MAG: hypothetical protein Q8P80_05690 [Candidatus Levybacteria bacterium]|nr:hypothetical protein [Candidatus Levybacteria bacterium]